MLLAGFGLSPVGLRISFHCLPCCFLLLFSSSVSYGRYDADHALVLCKMYQFEKGITHLYDKLKLCVLSLPTRARAGKVPAALVDLDSISHLSILLCHGFCVRSLSSYHEIVQYHMEHHQTSGILSACSRHGDKVPNLWVQALSYFAAQAEPYEEQIQIVLRGRGTNNSEGRLDGATPLQWEKEHRADDAVVFGLFV